SLVDLTICRECSALKICRGFQGPLRVFPEVVVPCPGTCPVLPCRPPGDRALHDEREGPGSTRPGPFPFVFRTERLIRPCRRGGPARWSRPFPRRGEWRQSAGGKTVSTRARCSASCRLAEPAAGEEEAGRDIRVNGRSSCSEKTNATKGHGPMFAGSSWTHRTSPAFG